MVGRWDHPRGGAAEKPGYLVIVRRDRSDLYHHLLSTERSEAVQVMLDRRRGDTSQASGRERRRHASMDRELLDWQYVIVRPTQSPVSD